MINKESLLSRCVSSKVLQHLVPNSLLFSIFLKIGECGRKPHIISDLKPADMLSSVLCQQGRWYSVILGFQASSTI